ncbi:MAG: hypothetical protein IH597_12975 [Bacteroidales bacterium]|nr:hypothetical protein [Bacteroidales bacterium]
MRKEEDKHTGFAIALAWPETLCKQPNSWYDKPMRWLGINKNWLYKAGHAALVLINDNEPKCHYFDFGRYHSPFNFGRVRSAATDHDLAVKTIPRISDDGTRIENFSEILDELQQNKSCHGDGKLYASYCRINFEFALQKALHLQVSSPLPYGPFVRGGSNCSRFVNDAIVAGKPVWHQTIRLKYFVPLTPTTLNNVNSLKSKTVISALAKTIGVDFSKKLSKDQLKSTLPAPPRHPAIPENAQWISGEGAGSWFHIIKEGELYAIARYGPEGNTECKGLFSLSDKTLFTIGDPYKFFHLSHCSKVQILQNGQVFVFTRSDEIRTVGNPKPASNRRELLFPASV